MRGRGAKLRRRILTTSRGTKGDLFADHIVNYAQTQHHRHRRFSRRSRGALPAC